MSEKSQNINLKTEVKYNSNHYIHQISKFWQNWKLHLAYYAYSMLSIETTINHLFI